jgi:plastocyanin
VLAAALLAGCGGGDDGEPGGGGGAATTAAGETLRVVGDEYFFSPAAVVVRGGGELTIRLENEGSLAHNLRLRRGGRDAGGTPTFAGGESGSDTVRLSAGRYEMLCTVGDHAELGMTGELQVKE